MFDKGLRLVCDYGPCHFPFAKKLSVIKRKVSIIGATFDLLSACVFRLDGLNKNSMIRKILSAVCLTYYSQKKGNAFVSTVTGNGDQLSPFTSFSDDRTQDV